jgi:hypothetical protein
MKRTLGLLGLVVCLGCAPAPAVAPHGPPDHAHLIQRTVVVGENHVSLLVDHRDGEAALLITDRQERPRPIRMRGLEATFRLPDGTRRQAVFEPTSWLCRRGSCLASEYVLQAGWLRSVHRFELEMVVPLEGVRYKITFDYSTSEAEDVHHRHERLD